MLKMPDLLEEQPERLYSDTESLLIEAFENTVRPSLGPAILCGGASRLNSSAQPAPSRAW